VSIEETPLQVGDNVRVRSTDRRAQIIEVLARSHYRVLFVPEPAVDALDRDTPQDADDAGGVYSAEDLEPIL
jgi:hypothetical protein